MYHITRRHNEHNTLLFNPKSAPAEQGMQPFRQASLEFPIVLKGFRAVKKYTAFALLNTRPRTEESQVLHTSFR
jgi:hypothetical protein